MGKIDMTGFKKQVPQGIFADKDKSQNEKKGKNKVGRPAKTDKRSKHVQVYFTTAEYNKMMELINKEAELSAGAFIRRALKKQELI